MQPETTPKTDATQPAPRHNPWGIRLALAAIILAASGMALGIGYLRKRSVEELSASPEGRARADIIHLERMVRHFMRVTGEPPSTEQGLQALIDAKVMGTIPLDPWGHPYVYTREKGVGRVMSLGRDGREGGEGEDADIISRGP